MTTHVRVRINPTDAPSDIQTRINAWQSDHGTVRPGEFSDVSPRNDGTRAGYIEAESYFDVQDDPAPIIDDLLSNHVPRASWLIVQSRQVPPEGNERDDPAYYDPGLSRGLRVPVDVSARGHTVQHGGIDAVINGSEVHADAGEVTVQYDGDTATQRSLWLTELGEVQIVDTGTDPGLSVADLEVHPAKIVGVDTRQYPEWDTGNWTTDHVRGSPPTYLSDPAEPFPDPLPSDYFDRTHVDQSDFETIAAELQNITDDNTRAAAKKIVRVVFDKDPDSVL